MVIETSADRSTMESRERESADVYWVPWNARGLISDSLGGIRKRYIKRSLVQEHGATHGCARRFASPCVKVSKTV